MSEIMLAWCSNTEHSIDINLHVLTNLRAYEYFETVCYLCQTAPQGFCEKVKFAYQVLPFLKVAFTYLLLTNTFQRWCLWTLTLNINFWDTGLMDMHFNTSRGFNPSPAPKAPRHSEPLTLPFYIAESSMRSFWHWKDGTAALQLGSDKQHPTAHSGPWFEWTIQQGTHIPGSWYTALYKHFVTAGNRLLQEGLLTWAASPHAHDPGSAGDAICKEHCQLSPSKQLYKLTALYQCNMSAWSSLRGLCFHE